MSKPIKFLPRKSSASLIGALLSAYFLIFSCLVLNSVHAHGPAHSSSPSIQAPDSHDAGHGAPCSLCHLQNSHKQTLGADTHPEPIPAEITLLPVISETEAIPRAHLLSPSPRGPPAFA